MARWLCLAGVLSPLILAVATIALGCQASGYSHAGQPISALAAQGAVCADTMRFGGLVPYGVLMGVFAYPVHRRLGDVGRRPARLLMISGSCVALAGIFSCDPGCPPVPTSLEGKLHMAFALVGFVAMIWAPIHLGVAGSRAIGQTTVARPSCLLGFAALGAFVALMVAGPTSPLQGLFQRAFLGLHGVWMIVTAVQLMPDGDRPASTTR